MEIALINKKIMNLFTYVKEREEIEKNILISIQIIKNQEK